MPKTFSTECPHCGAVLRLKNRNRVGKKVSCPKCTEPFVVELSSADSEAERDEYAPKLPPRKKKRNPSPIPRRKVKAAEATEEEGGFSLAEWFSRLVWINANVAVAFCLVDNLMDFFWLVTHFNEVYQQVGIGRFAVRQVGRPLFIAMAAMAVWLQSVWPRDIATRPVAFLFGGGFLLLFGVVALLIGSMMNSVYDRPIAAVQWSSIYLGVSLILFGIWGFGPETPVAYAERLMANGRFHDALIVVQQELEKDPDNIPAIKLEGTLRDIVKGR